MEVRVWFATLKEEQKEAAVQDMEEVLLYFTREVKHAAAKFSVKDMVRFSSSFSPSGTTLVTLSFFPFNFLTNNPLTHLFLTHSAAVEHCARVWSICASRPEARTSAALGAFLSFPFPP